MSSAWRECSAILVSYACGNAAHSGVLYAPGRDGHQPFPQYRPKHQSAATDESPVGAGFPCTRGNAWAILALQGLETATAYAMMRALNGEVAEWSKAHAWKVCIRKRIEGSNPSLTAINQKGLPQRGGPFWFRGVIADLVQASGSTNSPHGRV